VVSTPVRGLDVMRDRVVILLRDAGRTVDALALLEDPLARAREKLDDSGPEAFFANMAPSENRGEVLESLLEVRFFNAAQIWALALMADHPDVADSISKLVLERDKTGAGRKVLVEVAWQHDLVNRAPCSRWLDEAKKLGTPDKGLRDLITPDPSPEPAAEPPTPRAGG
jgi:hypothetical protein